MFRIPGLTAALAPAALLMLGGCRSNLGLLPPASRQALDVSRLWRLFFLVALAVGVGVWGLIAWAVVVYRRRSDELPKQTPFNIPLEIVYTIVPLIIVGFLFAATMRVTGRTQNLSRNPDLVVEVTAFQWQWRFRYPGQNVEVLGQTGGPAEMVLPVGATVRMVLTSADVIHAFFVPNFMVKRDAIPGRTTTFDLKVTRSGTFTGRCAEYCGLDHDRMTFTVRAVSRSEFDAWAGAQRQGGSRT